MHRAPATAAGAETLLQSFGVQRRIYRRARRNAIEPGRQMGVLAHVELQGERPTQHGEQVGVGYAETASQQEVLLRPLILRSPPLGAGLHCR